VGPTTGKPDEHRAEERPASDSESYQSAFNALQGGNYAEALRQFRRCSESLPQCSFYLGRMYEYGQGVSRDYQEAESWYKKAANRGYSTAFYSIGLLHINGGPGIPQDCNAARGWFQRSAAAGNPTAQQWLTTNPSCR
jgi:TPR repeat protein